VSTIGSSLPFLPSSPLSSPYAGDSRTFIGKYPYTNKYIFRPK
jgi:hypothetical protein